MAADCPAPRLVGCGPAPHVEAAMAGGKLKAVVCTLSTLDLGIDQ
ncbi:MAG: hypothetical protein R3C46_04070 [Hyphomonadaceae bacterium]